MFWLEDGETEKYLHGRKQRTSWGLGDVEKKGVVGVESLSGTLVVRF